jgi:beta-galactosidase
VKKRVGRRRFLKLTSAALAGGAALGSRGWSWAAEAGAPVDPGALRVRLTGGWQFSRGGLGGAWETQPNVRDLRVWAPIELPHCVNAADGVDPDIAYYQGRACYRTMLPVANPFEGGRTLLHFEGAGQKADVHIGTEKVGTHHGGYDEFVVDITDAAARHLKRPDAKGAVPLVVICDNTRETDGVPSSLADFSIYGGLYRHVNRVYAPAVSLERVHVVSELQPKGGATATVRARLYAPAAEKADLRVHVRVTDPKGATVHESTRTLPAWSGAQDVASFAVTKPALWSPRTPALYTCTVTVAGPRGEHAATERFGLRRFELTRGGPFKLNGEVLFLRGTHRHEDHAGLGAAMTDDLVRKEMALIKDVGANFIRLGHYQQGRLVLDLCDELGFLVWEEIQWCRGTLPTERSREHVKTLLTTLIDQHRNHPSIVFWGVGNEVGWPEEAEAYDQGQIRAIVKDLHDTAHRLDPSRMTALRRTEYCADIVDVFAPSIWAGWYSGRYTEYKANAEKLVHELPSRVFHAEWGADSHAGRHAEDAEKLLAQLVSGQGVAERGLDYLLTGGTARASRDGDWSETYACNLFDWHLKEQETMREWFAGSAQWIFKDFSTPHRPDNPVPFVNQKGLVERDLTPKEAYYVFQSYWAEKPMVRVYSHSWPVRWGDKDEEKLVKVYSNCPDVELFLNGVSVGARKRVPADFPAAGLRWLLKLEEGENHLRAVGRRASATVDDEIRFEYRTAKWGAPAKLVLEEGRREGDTVLLRARVTDAQGLFCLDSRVFVRFDVAGDGRLADNLGTPSGSRKVQLANGRAQIRLRLGAGPSAVSLKSAGLPTVVTALAGLG